MAESKIRIELTEKEAAAISLCAVSYLAEKWRPVFRGVSKPTDMDLDILEAVIGFVEQANLAVGNPPSEILREAIIVLRNLYSR